MLWTTLHSMHRNKPCSSSHPLPTAAAAAGTPTFSADGDGGVGEQPFSMELHQPAQCGLTQAHHLHCRAVPGPHTARAAQHEGLGSLDNTRVWVL